MSERKSRASGWILACLAGVLAVAIAWLVFALATREAPPPAQPSSAVPREPLELDRSAKSAFPVLEHAVPPSARGTAEPSAAETSYPGERVTPFVPPTKCVLYGVVRGSDGRTLRGAFVNLFREGVADPVAATDTDGAARYSFAGIEAGKYELRVKKSGYLDRVDPFDLTNPPALHRRDVVLNASWILAVRLRTSDGRPLPEVLSALARTRSDLGLVEVSAVATRWDPQGDFPPSPWRTPIFGLGIWKTGNTGARDQIPPGCAGYLELEKREPLWISAVLCHRVLAKQRVEAGQAEVAFEIDLQRVLAQLGTVRVRVVDAMTHAPIEGARVHLNVMKMDSRMAQTDAAGRAELVDQRPGIYNFRCDAGKARSTTFRIALEPSQVLDLGDLSIAEPRVVKGRVENRTPPDRPVGLEVLCLDPAPHPALQRAPDSFPTTAEGTFEISLQEGRYLARVIGASCGALELDTRALGDAPLVIALSTASEVRVEVRSTDDVVHLALFDAEGRPYVETQLREGARFPIACAPGAYRLDLLDRHGKTTTRQLQVGVEPLVLRIPE